MKSNKPGGQGIKKIGHLLNDPTQDVQDGPQSSLGVLCPMNPKVSPN